MLKEARERWAARRAVRDGPLCVLALLAGSLLAASRDNPGWFRDKPFKVSIFEHFDPSPEAERGVKAARAEYEDTGGRVTLEAYEELACARWLLRPGFRLEPDPPHRQTGLHFEDRLRPPLPTPEGAPLPSRSLHGHPASKGLSAAKEMTALAAAATKVMLAQRNAELTVTAEEFGRPSHRNSLSNALQ